MERATIDPVCRAAAEQQVVDAGCSRSCHQHTIAIRGRPPDHLPEHPGLSRPRGTVQAADVARSERLSDGDALVLVELRAAEIDLHRIVEIE